jgi:hypothetical protein
MKALKLTAFLIVFGAVFAGFLPQSGVCQMSNLKVFACTMPCCKRHSKNAPTCPMIRAEAPRDIIASSTYKVAAPQLLLVARLSLRDFVVSLQPVESIQESPPLPRVPIYLTPQNSPAPPPSLA